MSQSKHLTNNRADRFFIPILTLLMAGILAIMLSGMNREAKYQQSFTVSAASVEGGSRIYVGPTRGLAIISEIIFHEDKFSSVKVKPQSNDMTSGSYSAIFVGENPQVGQVVATALVYKITPNQPADAPTLVCTPVDTKK